MKRIIAALVAASSSLFISCISSSEDSLYNTNESGTALTGKIVGGIPDDAAKGSLLIRLDAETARRMESGDGEAVAGELFADMEVRAFRYALGVKPKNMEVAEKYGLDRWYEVCFDEDIPGMTVANSLASRVQVQSIQFNSYIELVVSQESVAFSCGDLPYAKSSGVSDAELPFDDPYLRHQWNLVNDGSIEGSLAGADVGVKDAWRLTGGDPSVVVAVFDCAVKNIHPDLADAVWKNQEELDGTSGVDDDGNGYIDDIYGFNFVRCYRDADFVNGSIDGTLENVTAINGEGLDWSKGSGHGTHVGGIIGAVNNNGKGVSSVAGGTGKGDGVRLMSCQIFNGTSNASDAESAAAFIYAADNGACIAQCSYGSSAVITDDNTYIDGDKDMGVSSSTLENAALRYFLDPANSNHESLQGNIAVFAAGNHGNPYSSYPGALPYVISVTAYCHDFLPGGYTNYGPGCNIAAPGGDAPYMTATECDWKTFVLSTGASEARTSVPGATNDRGKEDKSFVYMQGTSMACPHVSGVVALGISYAKKLGKTFTRDEFTSLLLTSTNDLDQYLGEGSKSFAAIENGVYVNKSIDLARFKGRLGTGAVDAWKFLMAIEGTPSFVVKAGEETVLDLSGYFGDGVKGLSLVLDPVDAAAKASLGLSDDNMPVIENGCLRVTCTKVGAGKMTIRSSVGKDPEREDGIGGLDFFREISIVSRCSVPSNKGWL